MDIKRLIVGLPKDMHKDLKAIAFYKNITMTDIVIETLREVITKEKAKGTIPEFKRES